MMKADKRKRITLRIPANVHDAVAVRAKREQRSLNEQIVFELRQQSESRAA